MLAIYYLSLTVSLSSSEHPSLCFRSSDTTRESNANKLPLLQIYASKHHRNASATRTLHYRRLLPLLMKLFDLKSGLMISREVESLSVFIRNINLQPINTSLIENTFIFFTGTLRPGLKNILFIIYLRFTETFINAKNIKISLSA